MMITRENLNNLFIKCTFIHRREAMPEWGFDYRCIAYDNLLLIYDGSGIFESNGERRRVGRGDLVFFRHGGSQRMRTDRERLLKLYTVNFSGILPELSDGNWSLREAQLPFDFVTHIQDEEIFHRLMRLFDRLWRIHLTASYTREAEERAVFAQILELAFFCGQPKGSVPYRVKNQIDSALRYMAEHYREKLTLRELAEHSGLSASHFSAVFKKVTGSPPMEYLIRLRITRAKRLLEDGRSVSDAAQESGFSDIYYFSNVFKKCEGQSPRQYARSFRAFGQR